MFSNKIVTFVAIYPKQLFVDRCPTFLFSKLVRRLVEPSGYINCEKCLALKYKHYASEKKVHKEFKDTSISLYSLVLVKVILPNPVFKKAL